MPKPTVTGFFADIKNDEQRRDSRIVARIMSAATKSKARVWAPNIVGFGERTITYADGREARWMLIGFSPRKANLTLYVGRRFENRDRLLKALGKHKMGGGCLYIKRLSDVHLPSLKKIVVASVKRAKQAG
ncbi:MAG TPA: hypothetical protein VEU08_19040 [Vicinamibacterales bacterium]|nr:hypothetical protein [Vicinamibacterales bacterium]